MVIDIELDRAGFGRERVIDHDDDAGVASILDAAVEGGRRGGVDYNRVVAFQHQILQLGDLLRRVVIAGDDLLLGDHAILHRLVGDRLPGVPGRLFPGVRAESVGQRDPQLGGIAVRDTVLC